MATDTILGIIIARNSSLTGDSRLDDYISLSKMHMSACAYRDKYNYAIALMTLHMVAMDDREEGSSDNPNSSTGNVRSKKEGKLTISYSPTSFNGSVTKEWLNQTTYGQELNTLTRRCIFTARTRFMGCRV